MIKKISTKLQQTFFKDNTQPKEVVIERDEKQAKDIITSVVGEVDEEQVIKELEEYDGKKEYLKAIKLEVLQPKQAKILFLKSAIKTFYDNFFLKT